MTTPKTSSGDAELNRLRGLIKFARNATEAYNLLAPYKPDLIEASFVVQERFNLSTEENLAALNARN